MASGFLRALIWSPWYALVATLAVIPLLLLCGVVVVLLVLGAIDSYSSEPGLTTNIILYAIALAVVTNVAYVMIGVQLSRFAASLSGGVPLVQQPPYGKAFLKGLTVCILVSIAIGLVSTVLWVGAVWLWQVDSRQILLDIAALEETGEIPTYMAIGFRIFSGVFTALLAILFVARVIGLTREIPHILGPVSLIYRLVVVVPLFVLISFLSVMAIGSGIGAVLDLPREIAVQAGLGLEQFILGALFFAHEALLLGMVRHWREEYVRKVFETVEQEKPDYAEIRARWSS